MNLHYFKFQLYDKALKVIKSCKTMDQLENTERWINQIFKRVYHSGFLTKIIYKEKIYWMMPPPACETITSHGIRQTKDPVKNDIILLQIRTILSNTIIKKRKELEDELFKSSMVRRII